MNAEAKNFSRNLKLLMKYHQDTQKKLEKRSGVSQKTISNMLNPGDETSPTLSKVLS
jgi:transcriptional regulator with XRE-family HTH domain